MQNTKYVLAKRPFEAIKILCRFYQLQSWSRSESVTSLQRGSQSVSVWPTLLTNEKLAEPRPVGLVDRIPTSWDIFVSATHNCSSVSPVGIIIVIGLCLSCSRLTNSFLTETGLSVCTRRTGRHPKPLLWWALHKCHPLHLNWVCFNTLYCVAH